MLATKVSKQQIPMVRRALHSLSGKGILSTTQRLLDLVLQGRLYRKPQVLSHSTLPNGWGQD
jgi:hypothetical protein